MSLRRSWEFTVFAKIHGLKSVIFHIRRRRDYDKKRQWEKIHFTVKLMKKIMCGNIRLFNKDIAAQKPRCRRYLQYQLANMPGSSFLLKSSV